MSICLRNENTPGNPFASALAIRLALLAFTALLPAIGIGYLSGDDDSNFLNNMGFRGVGWTNLRWAWTTVMIGVYQPVAWMLLEVQYAAWGLSPRGYHIANLTLHAVNAAILFVLTLALVRRALPDLGEDDQERLEWSAALAVALFAVHPFRAEVVSWTSCQPYLPCALFSMLTLLTYLKAHEPGRSTRSRLAWLAGSFLLCLAAILSKAPAVVLPAVLLILDVYPLRRFDRDWRQALRIALEKVPFGLLSLQMMAVAVYARHSLEASVVHPLPFRIAQACYGASFYLGKTLVPTGLSAFYPFPRQPVWTEPRFLLGIAFVVVASAVAWGYRRRWPALAAGWAAYLVILAPSSGLVPMGRAMMADRYTYLAMMAWVAPLTAGVFLLSRSERFPRWNRRVVAPGALVAILGLSVLSWFQCATWRSDEALWTNAFEHGGADSSDVQNGLGLVRAHQGRYDEAERYFAKALEIDPKLASAENNMGLVLLDQGKLSPALPHFFAALRLKPNSASVYNNLGKVLNRQGKQADSAFFFKEAVRLNPYSPEMHNNLGMTLLEMGQADAAVVEFQAALQIKPTYRRARENLEKALAFRETRFSPRRPKAG